MKLLHSDHDFSKAQLGLGLFQLIYSEVVKELATWIENQEKIEMAVALEGSFQMSNERHFVYKLTKDFFLSQNLLKGLILSKILLLNLLKRIKSTVRAVPHKIDRRGNTLSDAGEKGEVCKGGRGEVAYHFLQEKAQPLVVLDVGDFVVTVSKGVIESIVAFL